jgi:hypothetical protein
MELSICSCNHTPGEQTLWRPPWIWLLHPLCSPRSNFAVQRKMGDPDLVCLLNRRSVESRKDS